MIFKSILRVSLVIILSVAILLIVAKYTFISNIDEDKIVKLGNLVGLDILDAAKEIEKKNDTLKKKISYRIVSSVNEKNLKYTVISQGNTDQAIKEGRSILLKISEGFPSNKINNYIGKPLYQVRKELDPNKLILSSSDNLKQKIKEISINKNKDSYKLNEILKLIKQNPKDDNNKPILMIGSITFAYHDKIPAGIIFDQNPKPGTYISKDTNVHFIVSLGKEKGVYTVKDYTGIYGETIIKHLNDHHINVKIKNIDNNSEEDGKILRQSVNPGTQLNIGDEIILYISNYNKNQKITKYKIIQFNVPSNYTTDDQSKSKINSYKSLKIRIIIKDNTGQTTIFEGVRQQGEKIVESAKVYGKAEVNVYINEKFYKRYQVK